MKNHIWVLEIKWEKHESFISTRHIAKTRDEGRVLLQDWKATLKGVAGIRVRRYDAVS